MPHRQRVVLVLVTLFLTLLIDQLTKLVAFRLLAGRSPIVFLGDVFRFEYAENSGAILSLGGSLSPQLRFWIFTVFVGAMLTFMLVAALGRFQLTTIEVAGLALISGGGFSNLGDRIFHNGLVIDFMNLGIGSLRTGVFNVADMAILGGAIVLVGAGLLSRRKTKDEG